MRNYVWISEFKSEEKLYNLDVFDDEYFVILRNNTPIYIAFPNSISIEFNQRFPYKSDCISVRDFWKKGVDIESNTVMHLLKDNNVYYNLIAFWREESNFIEDLLITKTRKEHLSIIRKN